MQNLAPPSLTQEFYKVLVDSKLETWIKSYEIKEPVQFFKLEWMTTQVEKVVEEVKNHLADKLEAEFATWQRSELQPFLASRLEKC